MSALEALGVLRMAAAALAVGCGLVFLLGGAIGTLRFPDHFTRLHASAVADPWGSILIVIGLAIVAPSWAISFRLLLLAVLMGCVGPLWSYLFGSAAYAGGLTPISRRYHAAGQNRSAEP